MLYESFNEISRFQCTWSVIHNSYLQIEPRIIRLLKALVTIIGNISRSTQMVCFYFNNT